MNGLFVAYYRVSTDRQGKFGLGLDAQQKAVAESERRGVISEFPEVETGKRNDTLQLARPNDAASAASHVDW
jgi:DNA invertase Pin-like site-specific DNA recombinase